MTPVPFVSVRNSLRKPIRPRDGMRNSMRTRPLPWLTILIIRPVRAPSFSVTTPMNSSGTSTTSCSIGSASLPSTFRVMTSGLPTDELVALAAHRLDQDRQLQLAAAGDLKVSALSVGSTRSATLRQQLPLQAVAELAAR